MDSRRYTILSSGSHGNIPNYTSAQLRAILGGLFTARAKLPWMTRPNQPDNIISWGAFVQGAYSPGDMKLCIDKWHERKYTHCAIGPFIDPGYHDLVPPSDFRNNTNLFVENILKIYEANIIPIFFLKPDGWSLDQLKSLEYIFTQPIWQQMVKMMVPNGWEPSTDTPNSEYVDFLKYGLELFPKALNYLHLAANFDAPGNNADLTPGSPTYIGNAGCWQRVAPYLHGYLAQYGPFEHSVQDNDPDQVNEFIKLWKYNRFVSGYAGWPTYSAWGNSPLDYIYAEGCSYTATWDNLPESACMSWGNLAFANGAPGVLDAIKL